MRNLVLTGVVLTLAPAAAAQDSVSAQQGLPGDAVSPFNTAEQLNTYVVDLQAFSTDWGTQFGIAPLIKSSSSDPMNFFSSLFGPQAASADLRQGVATPFGAYDLWNGQGLGVNDDTNLNQAGTPVNGPPSTSQFSVMFEENNAELGNIVTGVVNYDPADPTRLYVARIPAVINESAPSQDNASFGLGAIDADGNAVVRADGFGLTPGPAPVSGSNIFRVDALARDTSILNDIAGNLLVPNALVFNDPGASTALIEDDGTTHNTPGQIPESIAGRPVYAGSNFASQYVYENVAGSTVGTGAHLGVSSDHRGNVHFSKTVVFPGSIGTCTLYGKDVNNDTRVILLWGVDVNGNVLGTAALNAPATATDNCDATVWPSAGAVGEFHHHNSQVAFQGGNGQVSIGQDGAGNIIVATPTQKDGPANDNPEGAILVARFDPSDIAGTTEWTVAAYNEGLAGKAILDGPGGTAIGQCVQLAQVTGGSPAGNPEGPSYSAPFVDGGGNVWFIGAIETFGMPSDFDLALMRAVYDEDSFCYELEKVVEVGDVFTGQNSGTNYIVNFLDIADSNSIGSEAFWSGNGIQGSWEGQNVSGIPASDPRTLQGLVITAEIVYDVNNDGMFVKVTGGNGDPNSLDQEYNVMLYVGNIDDTEPPSGPQPYCTAKTSSAGCIASVTTNMPSVQPTSGAGDYSVIANGVQGFKPGIMFFGVNGPAAIPFSGGTLCMNPPLGRAPIQLSNGTGPATCDGMFTQNVNDGSVSPNLDQGPGTSNWCQFWNRDPDNGAGVLGTQLSNAIQLDYE